jgi:hypothetical protein
VAAAGCGKGGPCRVFATSSLQFGNFGGLEGGDFICNVRAADAGLPGTYMAWLSNTTSSPASRFRTKSTGPYLRTDDLPVAWNWAALTSGVLLVDIDRDETGTYVSKNREAWTNTDVDGTPVNTDPLLVCNDWRSGSNGLSGRVGDTDAVDDDWTNSHADPCNSPWRLYCFQQS